MWSTIVHPKGILIDRDVDLLSVFARDFLDLEPIKNIGRDDKVQINLLVLLLAESIDGGQESF